MSGLTVERVNAYPHGLLDGAPRRGATTCFSPSTSNFCRAGTPDAYFSGNGEDALHKVGWYKGNSGGKSHVVGEKKVANAWGLFDVHGNVWEWCQDQYQPRPPDNAVDPLGVSEKNNRVLRGGGWDRSAWHCRSAYRHSPTPDYRGAYMGFRLARTLPAPEGTANDRPRRPD